MAKIRNYVGLACSAHDSALAIVNSSGQVVFAEGTERWMQNKRALNIAPDVPMRVAQLISEHCDEGADIVAAFSWTEAYCAYVQKLIDRSDARRQPRPAGSAPPDPGPAAVVAQRLHPEVSGHAMPFSTRSDGSTLTPRQ